MSVRDRQWIPTALDDGAVAFEIDASKRMAFPAYESVPMRAVRVAASVVA